MRTGETRCAFALSSNAVAVSSVLAVALLRAPEKMAVELFLSRNLKDCSRFFSKVFNFAKITFQNLKNFQKISKHLNLVSRIQKMQQENKPRSVSVIWASNLALGSNKTGRAHAFTCSRITGGSVLALAQFRTVHPKSALDAA